MSKQYTRQELEDLENIDILFLAYDHYRSVYDKLAEVTTRNTLIEWFLKIQDNRRGGLNMEKPNSAKLTSEQSDQSSSTTNKNVHANQFDKLRDWLDYLVDLEFRDMIRILLTIKEQNRLPKPVDAVDRGAFLGQMQIYRRLDKVEQYLIKHYSERFD